MLNGAQKWRLQKFRNHVVTMTDVFSEDFAKVFSLLVKMPDARHSGIIAGQKLQEARDALMNFIDELDAESFDAAVANIDRREVKQLESRKQKEKAHE